MKSFVERYQEGANFWDECSQLLAVSPFREFMQRDPSEGKSESSNLMWAIAFVYDYDSSYAKQPLEDRIVLIENDFLKDKGYFEKKKNALEGLIDGYNKFQYDSPRRSLAEWNASMDKRSKFLKDTPYTLENAAVLDKIHSNTNKLFEDLDRIKESIEKADATLKNKGGIITSLLEDGDLDHDK